MSKEEAPEPASETSGWGGPTQLTAFEASMWRAASDPKLRSTSVGILVLDRSPDWDRLVEGHLRLIQSTRRLRQYVATPVLGLPEWRDDPEFLLDYHLRRQRLIEPGTHRQLLDVAEAIGMSPLDRARPPWEAYLIEGLEGGRAAYVMKMDHVLTDGLGLMQLVARATNTGREPRDLPKPRELVVRRRGSAVLDAAKGSVGSLTQLMGEIARGWATALDASAAALRDPRSAQRTWDYLSSARRVLAGPSTKGSPILRRRSRSWRFNTIEAPLTELKGAAKVAKASLNDVFLAGLIGGLRRYHEAMGVAPCPMPIAFPISVRTDKDAAGGNRFIGARFVAPVNETDPLERVAQVRKFVRDVRQEPALDVMLKVSPAMVLLPSAALSAVAGRLTASQDAQITNVPGFDRPIYIAGAEVTDYWPFGPLPGCAMMIAMLSYNGRCCIGINSDRAAVTEPELLAACLRAGLNEVIAMARPDPPPAAVTPKRRRTPRTASPQAAGSQ